MPDGPVNSLSADAQTFGGRALRVEAERDRYKHALEEIKTMTHRKGGDFALIWNIARRALEEGILDGDALRETRLSEDG